MITRRHFLAASASLPLVAAARPVWSAQPKAFAVGGLAINGTDPVAYFTEGQPVAGLNEFASDWRGTKMLFSTEQNKAMFDADPETFAPSYGGYCAYAVAKGYTASTDPEAWTIHDGRLFLNYSKSVRALWALRRDTYIARADENWPGVLDS